MFHAINHNILGLHVSRETLSCINLCLYIEMFHVKHFSLYSFNYNYGIKKQFHCWKHDYWEHPRKFAINIRRIFLFRRMSHWIYLMTKADSLLVLIQCKYYALVGLPVNHHPLLTVQLWIIGLLGDTEPTLPATIISYLFFLSKRNLNRTATRGCFMCPRYSCQYARFQ